MTVTKSIYVHQLVPKLELTPITMGEVFINKGDQIHPGKPLFEVENEKACVEIQVEEEGTVIEIFKTKGDVLQEDDILFTLLVEGHMPFTQLTLEEQLQEIHQLPENDRKALLKTIEYFIQASKMKHQN